MSAMQGGPSRRRRKAQRKGIWSERLAMLALMVKGYRIAERNFRCPLGEIDIVARKGDLVAFVEVKARNSLAEAVDAVSGTAQRRIADAAELWIGGQRDHARLSWRFDIVAVLPGRWPVHLRDAF